jgi:hypothetical protein
LKAGPLAFCTATNVAYTNLYCACASAIPHSHRAPLAPTVPPSKPGLRRPHLCLYQVHPGLAQFGEQRRQVDRLAVLQMEEAQLQQDEDARAPNARTEKHTAVASTSVHLAPHAPPPPFQPRRNPFPAPQLLPKDDHQPAVHQQWHGADKP